MTNKEFKNSLQLKSLEFSRRIIRLVNKFPNKRSSWVITDQLLRAAMSIGANITEAQAASSRKDFINFLSYALKSGNETKYWLILSIEIDPRLKDEINELINEADSIVRILGRSLVTLRKKNV